MFVKFRISNFLSILDEQEISFTNYSYSKKKKNINSIACLVGANGSGKTNLLRGFLVFLLFSIGSYLPEKRTLFNITGHFTAIGKPSVFFVEWTHENVRYSYEISVLNKEVVYERLRKCSVKNSFKTVFVRNEKGLRFDGIKISKQDKARLSPYSSLLSLLFEYGYVDSYHKGMLKPFRNILSNININNHYSAEIDNVAFFNDVSKRLRDETLFNALKKELEIVDTGIKDLLFRKVVVNKLSTSGDGIERKEEEALYSEHHSKGKRYLLPVIFESEGTQNYIGLFVKLYSVLNSGGLLIADELEKSLHMDLVERILHLFMSSETNKYGAQIIFSTHNPWFLQYLTKSEVFIIEKTDDSCTEAIRLDDIEGVRNDENFFIKYVNGAYDGKPKIKD